MSNREAFAPHSNVDLTMKRTLRFHVNFTFARIDLSCTSVPSVTLKSTRARVKAPTLYSALSEMSSEPVMHID